MWLAATGLDSVYYRTFLSLQNVQLGGINWRFTKIKTDDTFMVENKKKWFDIQLSKQIEQKLF